MEANLCIVWDWVDDALYSKRHPFVFFHEEEKESLKSYTFMFILDNLEWKNERAFDNNEKKDQVIK